jgi:hypothetical protein
MLGLDARREGGVGVREGDEQRIALGEQRHAVAGLQRTLKNPSVLFKHRTVVRAEQLG